MEGEEQVTSSRMEANEASPRREANETSSRREANEASSRREANETSFVDGVLDDLLPDDLDWRALVCSYPVPALVLSGLGGFLLGSRHGNEIIRALSRFASREVDRNISTFLGDDA